MSSEPLKPRPATSALQGGTANLLQHGAALGIGLFVTTLAGRHLAPSDFGFFSLVASVVGLLHLVIDHGTGSRALRDLGAHPGRGPALLGRLWAWRRRVGIGCGAALLVGAALEADPWRRAAWCCLAISAPFYAATALGPALVVGGLLGRMALRATLTRAGFAAGFLVLLLTRAPHGLWALLLVAREFVAARLAVGIQRSAQPVRIRPRDGRGMNAYARSGLALGLAGALQQLYFQGDVWLIRVVCGDVALGGYASAARLVNPLLIMPALMAQPFLPGLASSDAGAAGKAAARVCSLSAWIGFAISLGGLSLATFTADTGTWLRIYGDTYAQGPHDARLAFGFLAMAPLAIGFATGPMAILTARGRFRSVLQITAGGLAANLLGNALLLPWIGFVGAAISTLVTEIFVAWLALRLARPPIQPRRGRPGPIVLFAIVGLSLWGMARPFSERSIASRDLAPWLDEGGPGWTLTVVASCVCWCALAALALRSLATHWRRDAADRRETRDDAC